MNDAPSQLREAIRDAGLEPPEIIEPGKLHRFPGAGKRNGNTAGWCRLFDDGRGGCFGDWSSGLSGTWQANRDRPHARAERVALARRVAATKHRAATIWRAAKPAPGDYPYLVRKRIQPHGARIHKGALTLPVTDLAGTLTSLQFIAEDGGKRLLSGGRKQGCCIHVAGDSTSRVILCEGWATGCTLAAIDAGNLKPAAVAARHRWPATEVVIAGDDDRLTTGNPGATQARDAALASGALLALPPWPEDAPEHLTDFNDLAVWLAGGGA